MKIVPEPVITIRAKLENHFHHIEHARLSPFTKTTKSHTRHHHNYPPNQDDTTKTPPVHTPKSRKGQAYQKGIYEKETGRKKTNTPSFVHRPTKSNSHELPRSAYAYPRSEARPKKDAEETVRATKKGQAETPSPNVSTLRSRRYVRIQILVLSTCRRVRICSPSPTMGNVLYHAWMHIQTWPSRAWRDWSQRPQVSS